MKLKGLKREQRLNCEQLTLVAVRGAEPMGFFLKKKGKKVRQQLLKSNTSVKTLVVAGWKLRFNNWEIRNI